MRFYTTKQVAKLLGYKDANSVKGCIAQGTIKAQKFGGRDWFISEDEVARLRHNKEDREEQKKPTID